jgi:hypothetical protein
MIYRPAETPFLRTAVGMVANGLGMLLYQGARRWNLGSRNAPIEVMRRAGKNVYGFRPVFDSRNWLAVPFHLVFVFFVFGSMVGAFSASAFIACRSRELCRHRIVRMPCSIPWFLNIPLVTWLYLGQCRSCSAPMSVGIPGGT